MGSSLGEGWERGEEGGAGEGVLELKNIQMIKIRPADYL